MRLPSLAVETAGKCAWWPEWPIIHGISLIARSAFGQHKKRNRYLPKPSHMDLIRCIRRQKDLSRLLGGSLPSLAYDIQISLHLVCDLLLVSFSHAQVSHFFYLGSWEGDIRLWKLDSKLKSFSLVGTIAAPGFINTLQLISTPKDAFTSTSWATSQGGESNATRTSPSPSKSSTVLLVAGMGQEHRFGRWMKLKGEDVVNGTIVVALHSRTLV